MLQYIQLSYRVTNIMLQYTAIIQGYKHYATIDTAIIQGYKYATIDTAVIHGYK